MNHHDLRSSYRFTSGVEPEVIQPEDAGAAFCALAQLVSVDTSRNKEIQRNAVCVARPRPAERVDDMTALIRD